MESVTRFPAILILIFIGLLGLGILFGIIFFVIQNLKYSKLQYRIESIMGNLSLICLGGCLIILVILFVYVINIPQHIGEWIKELITIAKGTNI